MNSIWNKNFTAFKNRFPQLAQITGSQPVAPEKFWLLEKAKNGMISASEGGIRLHSAYNPEREAQSALNRDEVFSKSKIVFYGFGLGYHVTECAKLLLQKAEKNIQLVLIEPDIEHFFASMTLLDWTPVFELEKLVLAVGAPAEAVLPLLEDSKQVNIGETGVSDAVFFDIPAFTFHAASYFDAIRSIVKRNQRKNEINAATLRKFGKLWCRNSLNNLTEYEKCGNVSCLENKACQTDGRSLPFLIIGAGPSLENVLPYLKEFQDRCITVCVETSLRALLRVGVQPDFVILTDPQFWAYKHIAGLSAPQSILITEVSAYPAVFRFNCRRVLICSSQFPIGSFVQKKLGLAPGDLGTGGSVASSAWNFARLCGAREIFTAGLDFAFPGKQTHIKGSSAEQSYHMLASRLISPEKFTAASLYSANAVAGTDYTGLPVLTDSRMKMFAWWFEARLAACPETKTFTLDPRGLSVPGIVAVAPEAILQLPRINSRKPQFLAAATSASSPLTPTQLSELEKLTAAFPREAFLTEYPFLQEYL